MIFAETRKIPYNDDLCSHLYVLSASTVAGVGSVSGQDLAL
jgi:hypothetical protein